MITRKNAVWWGVAVVFALLVLPLAGKLVVGAGALVVYLISLWWHPFINCRSCDGTGRATGKFFEYTHRQCTDCGGHGRHRRLGVVAFHRNSPVWAESRAAKARDTRRARPL